jgi:hypothetical protein
MISFGGVDRGAWFALAYQITHLGLVHLFAQLFS